MLIVHVHAHVKPEFVEAFRTATAENARNSVLEPGILRFDVIQQADEPSRFVLIEVYRTVEATAAHKETAHYARRAAASRRCSRWGRAGRGRTRSKPSPASARWTPRRSGITSRRCRSGWTSRIKGSRWGGRLNRNESPIS